MFVCREASSFVFPREDVCPGLRVPGAVPVQQQETDSDNVSSRKFEI
jgi:hypothetical protein